jgi:hypothetical protein
MSLNFTSVVIYNKRETAGGICSFSIAALCEIVTFIVLYCGDVYCIVLWWRLLYCTVMTFIVLYCGGVYCIVLW